MSVADKFAGQFDCTGNESIFWRVRLISFVSTGMVAVLLIVEAFTLSLFSMVVMLCFVSESITFGFGIVALAVPFGGGK
jgi:hypothetical protein